MIHLYILKGRTPVPVEDLSTWSHWFETANRRVARSQIGNLLVKTEFMGVDHRCSPAAITQLFETVVDGSEDLPEVVLEEILGGIFVRYATWDEAERGHEQICRLIKTRQKL